MQTITEAEFAQAVDSRSDKPIYSIMKQARVGIAGLGGLGSNIAAALVRSGIGHLTLTDFDTVELSNINRQLYTLSHIGQKKAEALPDILREINPFCGISAHTLRVTAENCKALFSDCDIIMEAFDVPEQKAMLVNTVLEQMPDQYLISGSGMAGFGNANAITTRRITDRLTLCGDGKTDVADGVGLTASRVMVCAGHMAARAVEIILKKGVSNNER
ncbi:MAG: sulfur carrier protein ThiS adenylyltransferase ThiF [Oscillospiraceae bacterium]|nr:sulfur carrier protein ThiS adenylyltransferase ThiF [Oscillospiraceae bacterium]